MIDQIGGLSKGSIGEGYGDGYEVGQLHAHLSDIIYSSSRTTLPCIAPVTDIPTAEPAAALILSKFASTSSLLLQSVIVLIEFGPVTVARILTAPAAFISGQKFLAF